MAVELTDAFFARIAGWEAMKRARAYLAQSQVLSSNWTPPVLKGVVQAGEVSFRAGLAIKGQSDIENLCHCRDSRQWGTICAHSVAIGLHHLQGLQPPSPPPFGTKDSAVKSTALPKNSRPPLLRADSGEPLELHVILPPNFEQAVARGKIMIFCEGQWRGGRSPLNGLPKSQAFALSAADAVLLDRVEPPALLALDAKEFVALLPALAEHPRVTLGKSSPVTITKTPWPLALTANLKPSGEIELALKDKAALPALIEGEWVFAKQKLQPLGLSKGFAEVLRGPVQVTRAQIPQFLSQDWPRLHASGNIEANFQLTDFTLEPQAPIFLLELKGGLAQLSALLQCRYGQRIMTLGVTARDEDLWLPDPISLTRYSTRDFAAERAALARLQRVGFNGPDAKGNLQLHGQDRVLNFFAREFPRLQHEWQVTLEERLERSTAQNFERVEPQFQITSSGVQWFDLGVSFSTKGGEKFSAADIQRLLLSGQSHTRLRNGKFGIIDTGAVEELQEVLLDCSPTQHEQGYRVNNTQAGFLEATLRQHPDWPVQAPTAWRARAKQQSGEAKLECPPLGDLANVLRPYQKQGVAWLHFLGVNGFGGILADEMGLGKTLQTLAYLRFIRQTKPDVAPVLIVCPTSLVFNWASEAKKFTPSLRLLALQGTERHGLFEQIPQSDLVVTSYALIRRDAERYRALEFDTVVLDEAQHIKNRQTQNAQAVKAVRARHRLVLTGTPLENSVLDLWSIFDFLMPGYLGTAQDFRERYELPITREKSVEAQTRLARRLQPFILRRLKRDVAQDLPARLEQVSFCELNEEQRAVYQQVIEASRKEVNDAVGTQGLAKSRMVILTALLRLRQVCCDLRLLKLRPSAEGSPATNEPTLSTEPAVNKNAAPSGKLELFNELLEEVIDGGHRVLVFSQFVSMLTLLREQLAAGGIEYCYLDGSTTNRGEVVERFQQSNSIPVFLISLKAGGVGLNLTGADTVVHFDPWWNPAVEDQATDRAHRIGQTRVVTSYKLITRDTVEEKILALQARKREIIHATLDGEEQLAKALTWEEIQDLFA
ncbi:MAG: SNF2-related protein [Verrucomicrobiota bacterium]